MFQFIFKPFKPLISTIFPSSPVFPYLLFGFLVYSWPFIGFPLTDGDIANWAQHIFGMLESGHWLSSFIDQGHGPLLIWTAAPFAALSPTTYIVYNVFNLMMGLLGIYWVYYFCEKLWSNSTISHVSTFLFSTSLATVYLSRTPMYDWPATILLFGFCGFYLVYFLEQRQRYLLMALVCVAIGSLSRFSILLGLSGIYIILLHLIYRRDFWKLVRNGVLVLAVIGLVNFPWMYAQVKTFGSGFLSTFIYDNTGRYIKSTRPNSTYHADFYAFTLYTLIGFLPYTFALLAVVFNRKIAAFVKQNKLMLSLLAGFLPALVLFSFSGHTKLARYIAYVFPFLSMYVGYLMVEFKFETAWFAQRCKRMIQWTTLLIAGVLGLLIVQFPHEASESVLFTGGIIVLLFGLLAIGYSILVKHPNRFLANPARYLLQMGLLYCVFFSILSYEFQTSDFLAKPRQMLNDVIILQP